jgi:hypothetical protein
LVEKIDLNFWVLGGQDISGIDAGRASTDNCDAQSFGHLVRVPFRGPNS